MSYVILVSATTYSIKAYPAIKFLQEASGRVQLIQRSLHRTKWCLISVASKPLRRPPISQLNESHSQSLFRREEKGKPGLKLLFSWALARHFALFACASFDHPLHADFGIAWLHRRIDTRHRSPPNSDYRSGNLQPGNSSQPRRAWLG